MSPEEAKEEAATGGKCRFGKVTLVECGEEDEVGWEKGKPQGNRIPFWGGNVESIERSFSLHREETEKRFSGCGAPAQLTRRIADQSISRPVVV